MSEKFCLKWNDFQSNVSKSFGLFRNEDYLHDVTLVSDDNQQFTAHKLVLSACSEFFKKIFQHNSKPNAHPLLCLDGISSGDLINIMDYIYSGEVQILQDNLDRFLSLAQRLKLEGLMGKDDLKPNTEDQEAFENTENVSKNEKELPYVERKHKIHNNHQSKEVATFDKIEVSPEDISELKRTIEQYIEKDADGKFACTLCGRKGVGEAKNARSNLERHIETHLEGLSFPCQLCGKTFRSTNSFKTHKYKNRCNK